MHIFQLEHYDINRALRWIFLHFWKRGTQNKKPLIWTNKTRTLTWFSFIWTILIFTIGWTFHGPVFGLILMVIILTQPYILITLSIFILKPYEFWNRAKTIRDTRKNITSLKKTKVIGIAGSYGKTSVKNILYHLLSKKYKVLQTPLSYNTIFGIAQVVDFELDDSYDFFICELGEFKQGDITEMCDMVTPTYGIMTGINDQHLERFKNIQNTTATIFELYDYIENKKQAVVANVANILIASEIEKRKITNNIISYGTDASNIFASSLSFTDEGSKFTLQGKNQHIDISTPLLGNAHVNNILGATAMAHELGISLEDIALRLTSTPKIPHRFEQTLLHNGYLLVDNSYSSNSDSFREALEILKGLSRKNKILVTPGMVELGNASNSIHEALGALAADVCTTIILVGKSDRTESLSKGIGQEKIVFMDDIKNLWQEIEKLKLNPMETVVILENDLPDNY